MIIRLRRKDRMDFKERFNKAVDRAAIKRAELLGLMPIGSAVEYLSKPMIVTYITKPRVCELSDGRIHTHPIRVSLEYVNMNSEVCQHQIRYDVAISLNFD